MPELIASRLGVTPPAIRAWIEQGKIDPPFLLEGTGEALYSEEAVDKIERWYMEKAARGETRGPGSKQRIERAKRWISDNQSVSVTPAVVVTQEVQRWLELEDDLLPTIPLIVAVANRLDGPPVWLMIVAPASTGKSDVITATSALDGVFHISSITDKTFASGMNKKEGGKSKSLLERLNDRNMWLLTLKDFGTIQSLPPLKRNPIFGQLREIYDGQYDAVFGTGVEVNWKGKLGVIVGSTPAVDKQSKWSTEMGERFVQFRPISPDPTRVALKAAINAGRDQERHKALGAAYREAFALALEAMQPDEPIIVMEAHCVAAALARLTAEGRRSVWHPRFRSGTCQRQWDTLRD